MPPHILIADDDTVSRSVLAQVLSDRGNTVSVADDGLAALRLLGSQRFDLAILDYHMPMLDGVGAARKMRDMTAGADRLRFIGVTADPNGLEERDENRALFDAIVQKPFNVQTLMEVVDASLRQTKVAQARDTVLGIWRTRGLDRVPRGRFAVPPRAATRAQLDLVFDLGRPENPDCILINDDADAAAIGELRTTGNLYTLPAVDLTGRFPHTADAAFRPNDIGSWDDVAVQVRGFASRRLQLAQRFLSAATPAEQLLAYVFVSGRDLRPVADPDHDAAFPGLFPIAVLLAAADALVAEGLLVRLRGASARGPTPPHFVLSDAALEQLVAAPRTEPTLATD